MDARSMIVGGLLVLAGFAASAFAEGSLQRWYERMRHERDQAPLPPLPPPDPELRVRIRRP